MLYRVLFLLGAGMAVAVLLVAAVLISHRIDQIEAVRTGFWDNLAYTTSQTDFELVRLIDTLSQVQTVSEDPPSPRRVSVRFEVALSRFQGLTEGRTGQRVLSVQEARDAVESGIATLENLEPSILAFGVLPVSEQAEVLTKLRALSQTFHRATVKIASLGDRDQTAFYNSLARNAYSEIVMLVIVLIAGGIAFVNSVAERRRFLGLNESLAEQVRERTEDLEASNEELRQEMVERKRLEDAEERQRNLLVQAAELVSLGYYVRNCATGEFEYISKEYGTLFGLDADGGTVRTRDSIMAEVHPEDRAAVAAAYEDLRLGKKVEFDYRIPHGGENTYVREIVQPVFDGSDEPIQEIGTTLDWTEAHNADQRLFSSQKLESIGQLTGGVAHDFNNLLAIILGNAELIKTDPADQDSEAARSEIMSACERGGDLTRRMLAFARQAMLEPKEVDLNDVVRSMQNLVFRTVPENIRIETVLMAGLWKARVDTAFLESALLNLVINARDAMEDGGKLTVETANFRITDEYIRDRDEDLEPGRYVMLAVSDTGVGIPPNLLEKVVEPFVTTKGPGMGSGLGLAMVHGFVKQSGGTLRLYSEPACGTTVKLYLPAVEEPTATGRLDQPASSEPSSSLKGRLLLVEDEDAVRQVVAKNLAGSGLGVTEARNGEEAIEVFDAHGGDFDVLLTDVVMPGTHQGPALATELTRKNPNLRVVFMSGYPTEAAIHGNGLRSDDRFLMKPVQRARLLKVLNELMEEA